ncbi:hypothetical protein MRB53_038135 [Persea americana]|nr:hypothetical protein MRB53_038135 [Persea americana]
MLIESNVQITKAYKRLRVWCTFADRSSTVSSSKTAHRPLSMTRFYQDLHRSLQPIHKPLLASTSIASITQRLEGSRAAAADAMSATVRAASATRSSRPRSHDLNSVYDLIFDPILLTVHTSIPNVPEPGTPAAEGIISTHSNAGRTSSDPSPPSTSLWTRVEALNVHSPILNTLLSVKLPRTTTSAHARPPGAGGSCG